MCLEIQIVINHSDAGCIVIKREHKEDFWDSSHRHIFVYENLYSCPPVHFHACIFYFNKNQK